MSQEKIIDHGLTVPHMARFGCRFLCMECQPSILFVIGTFKVWLERWCQRRALVQLDNRLLNDIGVTKTQALHEIAKPFWRP